MSRYRPSTYDMQGVVLTLESRGREVARGLLLFQNLGLPVTQWPGLPVWLPAVLGLLAQVPFAAQCLACYGVCVSSYSWALSHQRAVVGVRAGRPAPKPLAWRLEISLTLAAVSSGTGPGRMWFLRPVLHVGED